MNFDSTDKSCRFRSFAEAEQYAEKSCQEAERKLAALLKLWESYSVYVIDGRVSYSPPEDKSRIKRMCLGCRRREVLDGPDIAITANVSRVRRSKSSPDGPSGSST